MKNKTLVNQETILKRNLNKLKKMYKDAVECEEHKKKMHREQMSCLFKSIGTMTIEGDNK